MNAHFYWRSGIALLLAVTLCLTACDHIPESLKRPNMTALSPRLQPLFEHAKTVCFGHFVIDVPNTATVVFGGADVDWPITFYLGEGDKVAQHVAAQLIKVEKERKYFMDDEIAKFPLFGTVMDGVMPGQKLVFGSVDHATYSMYSFIPVGKDLFVQNADSVLSTGDEIQVFNTVARNLRLRADDEIPNEAGACIDGGFVKWQPKFEKVTLGVRLKEFPDVHFSIDATKKDIVIESDALEPRLKAAERDAQRDGLGALYASIKTLRRGQRQIGGWNGFEALAHKPAYEDMYEAHEFLFLSQGATADPLLPTLDLRLDTGVEGNSTASSHPSLTDEEAVAVWDKLTSSIRVRPVGGAKHSASEPSTPPRTPLGESLVTGTPCPQTGWWQSHHEGDMAGGRRQRIVAGQLMPTILLLGPRSVWQKLTGERPSYETTTVWELVAYDAGPPALLQPPNAG